MCQARPYQKMTMTMRKMKMTKRITVTRRNMKTRKTNNLRILNLPLLLTIIKRTTKRINRLPQLIPFLMMKKR